MSPIGFRSFGIFGDMVKTLNLLQIMGIGQTSWVMISREVDKVGGGWGVKIKLIFFNVYQYTAYIVIVLKDSLAIVT